MHSPATEATLHKLRLQIAAAYGISSVYAKYFTGCTGPKIHRECQMMRQDVDRLKAERKQQLPDSNTHNSVSAR